MQTQGISPKVIASAITGVIVYALTKLAISIDPVIEQAINVAAMIVAGYLAPPATVEFADDEADPLEGNVPGGGPDVVPQ